MKNLSAMQIDQIVLVNGPHPPGTSDLKMFREHGLAHLLLLIKAKEKAVADGTYTHYAVSQRGDGQHDWKEVVAKN